MSFIQLTEANCRNCMRCVRVCPTQAMTYIDHQPKIVEDECILCGMCYLVCPHDAKKVNDNFKQVNRWLSEGEKVVMSVAPSFTAAWPFFSNLKNILIKKGFHAVEETAYGAKIVSEAYATLMAEHKMKNIITTCCPSVVTLIEKEYGDLVEQLAPVASPMIVHGMALKEKYPDAKVVFLSPCIAKQKEIYDKRFEGVVDATISMEELASWINDEIDVETINSWENFDGSIARLYPTPGGIVSTLERNSNYHMIDVAGIDRVRNVLESIRNNQVNNFFFELSACSESCLGGPLLAHFKKTQWIGQSMIRDNVDILNKLKPNTSKYDIGVKWVNSPVNKTIFSEEAINDVLYLMNKTTKDKLHDCGACGYETCREKAIAVLENKADYRLCLPDALERAESISSVIIENTPNGIIVLNQDYNIIDMNPSAKYLLNLENISVIGLPIDSILMDEKLISLVKHEHYGKETQYYEAYYDLYSKTFNHAIVKLKDELYTIIILMDITIEQTKEKVLKQIRTSTIQITQEVIDEQMRAVQEIASLLGETAAKSKVALTKLKKTMEETNE